MHQDIDAPLKPFKIEWFRMSDPEGTEPVEAIVVDDAGPIAHTFSAVDESCWTRVTWPDGDVWETKNRGQVHDHEHPCPATCVEGVECCICADRERGHERTT